METARIDPNGLFVYGTLRRGIDHPMARSLARCATWVGDGLVEGELYDLGNYPGLLLGNESRDPVHGELYALHPHSAESVLETLDRYEGTSETDPQPHAYERRRVTVRMGDGAVTEAWAYILILLPPGAVRVAGGDFVSYRWRKGFDPAE